MAVEASPDALYGQAGFAGWRPETPFADEWEAEPSGEEQFATAPRPVPAAPSAIPGQFFVRVVATKSGPWPGNATQAGREGWLVGRRFVQQVTAPRDVATGQPAGKRQHQPVLVVLDWSPASPAILTALTTNEALTSVTMEFMARTATGTESVAQRLTLTNAAVAGLRRTAGSPSEPPADEVTFVFQKLELTDLRRGTAAEDDWSASSELETAPALETPEPATEDQVAAGGAWTTDTYEPERAGLRPCADRTYVA
jgi:type VI secretion system secreted protein Hcp